MIQRLCQIFLLLFLLMTPPVLAEALGDAPIFDFVDVEVVNVEVFVTDRQGNAVTDLTRDDFTLLVDRQQVTLSNFYAQEGGRPLLGEDAPPPTGDEPRNAVPEDQRLHLVIFVDDLHLRPTNRKATFNHLRRFVENSLSPDDLVTLISQDHVLDIHHSFTADRDILHRALDEVERTASYDPSLDATERRLFQDIAREQDFQARGFLGEIRAYAQQAWTDARTSLESMERLFATFAGVRGRKAFLYVGDGIVTRPGEPLFEFWKARIGAANLDYQHEVGAFDLLRETRRLGRAANANGLTFYAIDAEDDHTQIGRSAAFGGSLGGSLSSTLMEMLDNSRREPIELVAHTTGGLRFQRRPRLAEDLGRLAGDLETFYSLGFTAEGESMGRDHRLEVKVNRPGLRVRHRETYRGRNRDERSASAVIAALLYGKVKNPMNVRIEPGESVARDDGNQLLPLTVIIPIENIALMPRAEDHTASLSLFVSVQDKRGNPRPVQVVPFHLAVPNGELEEARARQAAYTLPLVLRPGDQQVVIGVRDDVAANETMLRLPVREYTGP